MKMIIVVALALVASACAEEQTKIIHSKFNQEPEGAYTFEFETDKSQITRKEEGNVKELLDEENNPHKVVVVRGSSTYTDPEGNLQTINYYADETGYHVEGPSVPKTVSRR